MIRRLTCVVEGRADVEAAPVLCARILSHFGVEGWVVDKQSIRIPKGMLVDAGVRPPQRRPAREDGIRRALAIFRTRPSHGLLILCDQDDDCPAIWSPDACERLGLGRRGGAVMAVREFEAWFLHDRTAEELSRVRCVDPERKRGAKEALAKIVPGYLPSTHQCDLPRRLDIAKVRKASRSFDKLVRTVLAITTAG